MPRHRPMKTFINNVKIEDKVASILLNNATRTIIVSQRLFLAI